MTDALALSQLGYRYRSGFALDDIGLSVPAGCFTMLLGPNGAGKSTLVNLITRLYAPSSGSIAIGGHDLGRHPGKALARLGVVFQQSTLDLDLTLAQNLRYAAALHGMGGSRAEAALTLALARFGLEDAWSSPARALSGGNRRKLELARALLHQPALLVCDEATVGLDSASRRSLLAHLRRSCRDEGLAVLWTTHLMDEAEADDPVIVLQSGRIRAQGKGRALMERTGAANLEGAVQRLLSEGPS
ncbi:ABC transporter ATP-binding protein [Paramagnetospirillum magnetotacticum MS-1]|uniref:ABC transporter ATP-binding protein n=1 Tax=Paramagnetospirillum magnetotacticum MS-1 TaxID=272627 RepID=A0A0C2UDB5_PARME|nr:ATP-binding cassette domain-containing protein [Paramagnetospirillum magnetotacticum]KIL99492.1 ABC transporter ATP-binding protein [Paramagnetospirillum magnetotacticum MS-1]